MIMIQSSEAVDLPEDVPLYPSGRSSRSCLSNFRDAIAGVIACIGAMSMGFILGYSSPALHNSSLLTLLNKDEEDMSWFGSLVTLGAMLGGPLGAVCVGRFGRKTTLMMCNVPIAIGWFMIIFGYNMALLFSGRLLTGIGMGAVSLAAPMYVAEVSTIERRGALGAGFQLLVAVGVFVSYGLGALINWTWLAVAGAALAFIHAMLLLLIPETPRWLLSHHERQGAMKALQWLRGNIDVTAEFDEMEQTIVSSEQDGTSYSQLMKDFRTPAVYKPLLITTAMMMFQQLSGVNAVLFYAGNIFSKAGFGDNPSIPTVIVGAVLVASTVVSCVFADIAGRRFLLILSGTFMSLSIVILGLYFYLTQVKGITSIGWLSLVCLIVYIATFSLGWGPLPWLVTSELFSTKTKGVASGIATFVNWLAAFVTTKEFMALSAGITDYGAFWLFGGICFWSVVFIFFFLPETKGKSLEEIQNQFRRQN